MHSPLFQPSYYHVPNDGQLHSKDNEIPPSRRIFQSFEIIGQALPLPGEDSDLRTKSITVLIRAQLTRAHVYIIQGDLNKAGIAVLEAYHLLESLQDKSMEHDIDSLQQTMDQYRHGEYDHVRRNSASVKNEHHRPTLILSSRQRRGSHLDTPTPPATKDESLFKRSMIEVQNDMAPDSGPSNIPKSSRAQTDQDARGFFHQVAPSCASETVSQQAPSSSSSGEVSKLFKRLAYGDLSTSRPKPQVAKRATPCPPSGGIDMFYHRNYKDLPYSPNIKNYQTPNPDLIDQSTEIWNESLPTPSGFADPWKESTPRNSGGSYLQRLAHAPTSTDLEAPQTGRIFRNGLTSPIHGPSHPPPHTSIQISARPLARSRSSASFSAGKATKPARRASSEVIKPENTDGPALPRLLRSIQSNPHPENSLNSLTERVRRLSVEETCVRPTKRPSLSIPSNASSSGKSAASAPSPLRHSFSATDIEFESHTRQQTNPSGESPMKKPSPTTIHPTSFPNSAVQKSSPPLSPKSISTKSASPKPSPRTSRIPLRTGSLTFFNTQAHPKSDRSSTSTTVSEEIRRDEKREAERKKREAQLLEKQRKGEYLPAKLNRDGRGQGKGPKRMTFV